jgi:hypothetical protein
VSFDRRQQVLRIVRKAFPDYPCFMGFDFIPAIKQQLGKPFIYVDHAYIDRGYDRENFRVILSDVHQLKLLGREKPKGYQMKARRWKRGEHIVLFPPSHTMGRLFDAQSWAEETSRELMRHTDRKIRVKVKDSLEPLHEYLHNCHAAVGYGTVASVEAALAGIPLFCGPHCPGTPIGLADFSQIESPIYPDREPWFSSLTWSQFTLKEIEAGLCREVVLGAG